MQSQNLARGLRCLWKLFLLKHCSGLPPQTRFTPAVVKPCAVSERNNAQDDDQDGRADQKSDVRLRQAMSKQLDRFDAMERRYSSSAPNTHNFLRHLCPMPPAERNATAG